MNSSAGSQFTAEVNSLRVIRIEILRGMQGTLALTFALKNVPPYKMFSLSSSHLFQKDLMQQRVPAPRRQELPLLLGNNNLPPFLLVVPLHRPLLQLLLTPSAISAPHQ